MALERQSESEAEDAQSQNSYLGQDEEEKGNAPRYSQQMTEAQLNRYQSEEDESRRKFDAEQLKNTKLKQFRLKYFGHDVWLHICN